MGTLVRLSAAQKDTEEVPSGSGPLELYRPRHCAIARGGTYSLELYKATRGGETAVAKKRKEDAARVRPTGARVGRSA